MFTGIIQTLGDVVSRNGEKLRVRARLPRLKKGASVAVDGVCLTVVSFTGKKPPQVLTFDVSTETYQRTTLGRYRPGQKVNLETPLRAGDEFGGHFVLGHVDGTGKLVSKTPAGPATVLYEFSVPPHLMDHLAPKGSVAVDGISLTVVDIKEVSFTVAIIPHTEANTSLGAKKPGDPVNLETDMLAKHLDRLLAARRETPTDDLFVKKSLIPEEEYQ
ncbi:MAG TPA: riboflavin synthase [Elusimicrobiota bacterium]|nr:riboflavin synthase [Elusimicrobiota bacterium]